MGAFDFFDDGFDGHVLLREVVGEVHEGVEGADEEDGDVDLEEGGGGGGGAVEVAESGVGGVGVGHRYEEEFRGHGVVWG